METQGHHPDGGGKAHALAVGRSSSASPRCWKCEGWGYIYSPALRDYKCCNACGGVKIHG